MNRKLHLLAGLMLVIVLAMGQWLSSMPTQANEANASSTPVRRVNAPYLAVPPPAPYSTQPAIFWFGQVDNTSNYADGRILYTDNELRVFVHIMDRRLWYDTAPTPATLTDWDAVTLYLNLDEAAGQTPGSDTYQFVAQLNHGQPRDNYQAAYRGNGSGWNAVTIPFQTSTVWRGVGPNNNQDDRGWYARFAIPFASLGLSAAPAPGTIWGLAVVVHDRDDAAGTPIPDTFWPETMNGNTPASWGQLYFGWPPSPTKAGAPIEIVTIRHGLNGATVTDGHVGGHTVCGEDHWPDYFPTWGSANYAGHGQINIQNQWDVADWPCFSKYFVTFALTEPPADQLLLRAELVMHQFGSAWGAEVEPSFIQVLTVHDDWDETTLTWNNAPLAGENLSGIWVEPIFADWPGVAHSWDVTKGVVDAYARGEPLRLALYSADGAYHSGRYFSSSSTGEWNAVARPTLRIVWGQPCSAEDVECLYLPTIRR